MRALRIFAMLLLAAMLCGTMIACSDQKTPTGMQDVSVAGQDYMLFVPLTWVSNSRSGVSGAYYTTSDHSEKGEGLASHAKYWTITAQKVADELNACPFYRNANIRFKVLAA